ncbi:hypothetical protein HMPREF1022_02894 [Desulfovibrio sp. 6_1_46AFAA]|uniref:hypothetical protein n=1 Tax=Desulfovibrio sp. 6_1_46AFAA TaxID=665942 RepID=UPI0002236D51|nr:hypothetical protein [Desulfovibrio sp. 6_1_46AFAA]EGW50072.1 hypothetical protein HMPREF1022_02894 [Desulfovibrio sp. 6_1_46AFAA]
MTISETAQFIQDRALTLCYEGTHFRATAPATMAWLERAAIWAWHHDDEQLAAHLYVRIAQVQSARR